MPFFFCYGISFDNRLSVLNTREAASIFTQCIMEVMNCVFKINHQVCCEPFVVLLGQRFSAGLKLNSAKNNQHG